MRPWSAPGHVLRPSSSADGFPAFSPAVWAELAGRVCFQWITPIHPIPFTVVAMFYQRSFVFCVFFVLLLVSSSFSAGPTKTTITVHVVLQAHPSPSPPSPPSPPPPSPSPSPTPERQAQRTERLLGTAVEEKAKLAEELQLLKPKLTECPGRPGRPGRAGGGRRQTRRGAREA